MSVTILECPLCWVIAHARGNPDGDSEVDEWLRTATCVRDNLMEIQGRIDGFCGEAAYALAHLIDGTVVLGSYQFGGKPSEFPNPHYWVEKDGYIIDPTAEQYGDFEGSIVTKTGDKHYVYTEDTFRDEPSEVRRLLKKGFIDPAISMSIIEDLLKANCTAGIGLSKRNNMSLTLTEEEKEDYDHLINDAARKIYVFLRVERDLTHVGALEQLEEYAQWGEIPGVTSPLGRGEPVDNEIRALFGLPPIKGNPDQARGDPYTKCMRLPYAEIHLAIAPWHGPLMEQYKTKEDLCRHVVEDLESYTEEIELMKQEIEQLKNIERRRALNEEEQESLDFYEGHMEYATSLVSAIKELLTARAHAGDA